MPGKSVFWKLHFKELKHLLYAPYSEMYQLTETEMEILLFLRDDSAYNTARDICMMRGIAKSNVSNGVRLLERKGYVRIQIDEENRKIHRLFLTDKSRPIAEVLHQVQQDCLDIVLEGITEEEKTAMDCLFEKCDTNMQRKISSLKQDEES